MFLKDLEKIIKNKYEDQTEQIDHDALWGKVYPEIKKDKKRPFIFWLLGSGILILAIGTWFWSSAPENKSSLDQLADTEQGFGIDAEVKVDKELVSEVQDLKSMVIDLKESVDEINEKIGVLEVNNKVETSGHRHSNILSSASNEYASGNDLETKSFAFKAKDNLRPSNNGSLHTKLDANSLRVLPIVKKEQPIRDAAKPELMVDHLSLLPMKFLPIDDARILQTLKVLVSKKSIQNSKAAKPSVDVLLGYGFLDRSLTADERDLTDILNNRKANEDPLESWSVDLMVNFPLSSKLLVRAGLDYQMITERTNHFFETSEIMSSDSVLISTYEDDFGNITPVYGAGQVLLENKINRTSYNYFHSIGLPLQLVYTHDFNRLKMELGVGARFSKLFKKQGYLQEAPNEQYSLESDDLAYFQPKINTNLIADLGFAYNLSRRYSILTGIRYSYGLNGINSNENPIEQKYNLIKIKAGLRYQF